MNPEPKELTLEESLRQVIQTLPPVIRSYLMGGKGTKIAQNLMAKYSLRIDQAGVLEREIMMLLMGVESPDDFTQALATEARLDQKTVNSIVQDVNAQIFVPLREEMRRGASTAPAPAPARPSIQHPPLPRPPTPQRRPAEPERYFHLENKIPPLARPVAPLPPVFNPNIAPLPPKNVLPQGSQGSMGPKLLRDREEPHLELKKPAPLPPKPSFAPPNLPGVIQPPAPPVPPPPAKPYTTDPYREPIGGK